ncbi:MAG: cupin domain-containing protein [Rhizobiaceae bacterium]
MSRKITIADLPRLIGSSYPEPYDEPCVARERRRLGDAAGLTQFGVNLLRLPAGSWSSRLHWHTHEEEFVYVLEGEVVLVSTDGEETLKAGDAAGFKAGDETGHCLQNRSGKEALVLEVGSRVESDMAYYPGLDMVANPVSSKISYNRLDGTPYPERERKG